MIAPTSILGVELRKSQQYGGATYWVGRNSDDSVRVEVTHAPQERRAWTIEIHVRVGGGLVTARAETWVQADRLDEAEQWAREQIAALREALGEAVPS